MALLSHLLIAVAKTSWGNSSHFVCVFKRLVIFVRALSSYLASEISFQSM